MTSRSDLPTLPDELWLDIFSRVLQSSTKFPSSHHRVLILSWVCNRWRSLVISETKFWTTFHLFNNRVEMAKRERQEKLVDLCLQRSKLCQLDVILTDLHRKPGEGHHLNLPQCFLNQAYRWRSLRLEVAMYAKTLDRFSPLKGLLDCLESCTIIYKWRKRNISSSPIDSVDFLENAPRLQTLHLMFSARHSFPTKVPFSKLIELDLLPDPNFYLQPELMINEALTVLKWCPNLSRYRLACYFFTLCNYHSVSVVTHRNIRRLDVFGSCYIDPRSHGSAIIFDFLKLPLLTDLSITSYDLQTMSDPLHRSIDRFLDGSQGLLRLELHFPYIANPLVDLLKYLRLTPKLQHLFVLIHHTGYSKDKILHRLLEGDDVEPIFAWPPALHRLYFWKMDRNSTFAISSTPRWKNTSHSDESYLERRNFIQEAFT